MRDEVYYVFERSILYTAIYMLTMYTAQQVTMMFEAGAIGALYFTMKFLVILWYSIWLRLTEHQAGLEVFDSPIYVLSIVVFSAVLTFFMTLRVMRALVKFAFYRLNS
jgi:hypothetical protein